MLSMGNTSGREAAIMVSTTCAAPATKLKPANTCILRMELQIFCRYVLMA